MLCPHCCHFTSADVDVKGSVVLLLLLLLTVMLMMMSALSGYRSCSCILEQRCHAMISPLVAAA